MAVVCAILVVVPTLSAVALAKAERTEQGDWHAVDVPGGRATLAKLGVPGDRERAMVMLDLIRRLHFSANGAAGLEASLRELSARPPEESVSVALPSPLPLRVWSQVLARDIPPQRLFIEILNDEPARLLYHGLAGLDRETRQWFQTQPELLRWLYQEQDAVRSFSMFAPALRIVHGSIQVPGGPAAVQQWSSLLGAGVSPPETFVRRLFSHQLGRTAGLYFVYAAVDEPRRAFLMGAQLPAARRERRFERLVSGFSSCYPPRSTAYPFVVRSPDAALLLLEVELTSDGALAGPSDRMFWQEVLGDMLRHRADADEPGIDAAWMVNALCGALAEHRALVFATLLAGHRTFRGVPAGELPDVAAALRARRDYPALFIALEHAGQRRGRTYAAAARHAALLSRIDDVERSLTAVRQFQGALALILNARIADTLAAAAADTLIESLASITLLDGRYEGRIVEWLLQQWLPAVRQDMRGRDTLSAEQTAAAALAGPANVALPTLQWEGLAYMVDPAGTLRQRLLEIRTRQRGVSLDGLLALYQAVRARASLEPFVAQLRSFTPADEYQGDALDPAEAVTRADPVRVVDFLSAHVLPSWAYAPYLGTPDAGALVGGDSSLRHRLGVRLMGRDRLQQRWQIPLSPAARGIMQGSLVGVQTGLASWSLRRLSSDAVPAALAIDSNDTIPLTLTAALINPRRLADADLSQLAAAQRDGSEAVAQARDDPARLDALASTAALSPWARAVLPWIVREEPERVDDQFSPTARARIGGLRDAGLAEWGSVWMPSGSLAPRIPSAYFHELYAGRATGGIVGGRSIDVLLRVTSYLSELKLPASLAAPVLSFAMRDHLDRVRPFHAADADAFARQARTLTRSQVEDYVGALPAIGPLRPARP